MISYVLGTMKRKLKEYFRKYGYDILPFKTYLGKPDPLMPWETDNDFVAIYNSVIDATLVDRKRLFMLWQLVNKTKLLQGNIAECGVYRGGTALLLSKTKPENKTLHLFDTFSGMPETDSAKDHHIKNDFNDTSLPLVQNLLKGESNVIFHPGFFPETAESLQTEAFSLVHCDMDIYSSVLDCCKFFYPKLVQGGIILFDDYGAPSCPGAKQAVEEFCSSAGIYEIYFTTGQAIIYKY